MEFAKKVYSLYGLLNVLKNTNKNLDSDIGADNLYTYIKFER